MRLSTDRSGAVPPAERPLVEIPPQGGDLMVRGREIFYWDFDLGESELLSIAVEQDGVDVTLHLLNSEGSAVAERDRPTGRYGPEELTFVAPAQGRFRFLIEAPDRMVSPGHCIVHAPIRRQATDDDRSLAQGEALYSEARELLKGGAAPAALAKLASCQEIFARLGLRRRQALALHGQSSAHLAQGDLSKALEACDEALRSYREEGEPFLLAFILDRAGCLRLRLGRPHEAGEQLTEAIGLYEGLGEDARAAAVLAHLGSAQQAQGKLHEAARSFEEAWMASEAQSRPNEAAILVDWGGALLGLGRSREALERYSQALDIYQRLDVPRLVAIAANGVADAAIQLGDLEQAETALKAACETLQEDGKAPRDLAIALKSQGYLQLKRGKLSEAQKAYGEALLAARQGGDRQSEAVILLEQGYLHLLQKEPDLALSRMDEAGEIFTAIGDRKGLAAARARGAEALRDLGKVGEAWERIRPVVEDMETQSGGLPSRPDYWEIAVGLLQRLDREEPGAGHGERASELERLSRAQEQESQAGRRYGALSDSGTTQHQHSAEEGAEMDETQRKKRRRKSYRSIDDPEGPSEPVNLARSDLPGGGGESGAASLKKRQETLQEHGHGFDGGLGARLRAARNRKQGEEG